VTTISYKNTVPYVGNRPYADVKLGSTSPTYKCLVDTGADYLQLPATAAAAAGLSLAAATSHPVITAGGAASLSMLLAVAVEIEGQSVVVDVLFDPTNTAPPLAGRGVLLAAFELGFQPHDWLWV
jgi:predicted aspartyl protease